jgi:cell division septum initiation protein DivIVA
VSLLSTAKTSRRVSACRRGLAPVLLVLLSLMAPPRAEAAGLALVAKVGRWVLGQAVSYVVSKGIDWALGQDFKQQLEQEIPNLIQRIEQTTGPQRRLLEGQLAEVRGQVDVLDQLLDANRRDIARIKAEQERILDRVEALEQRMREAETRIDEIDSRLQAVEQALLRDCLDLRSAEFVGQDDYRHKATAANLLETAATEDEPVRISARLRLDTCTGDLTVRGLLVELTIVTRGRTREMDSYLTLHRVGGSDLARDMTTPLARWETRFERSRYEHDVQVREFFVPYSDFPFPGNSNRLALALTLFDDGSLIFSLPSRPLQCSFGSPIRCRWLN